MLILRRTAMGHRGRKSHSPIKLVTRRQSANVFLIPLTLSQDPLPAVYPSNAVLPSSARLSLLLLFFSLSLSLSSPPSSLLVPRRTEFITHRRDRRWYTPLNLQLGTCLPGTLIRAFVREPLVTVKRRKAPSAAAIRVDDSPLHSAAIANERNLFSFVVKTSVLRMVSFLDKFQRDRLKARQSK